MIGGVSVNKPIVISGTSYYEQAIRYLHHRVKPDYPAAANYLRKALEELIQKNIPLPELVDSENVQLPEHKLTVLLDRVKRFLVKASQMTGQIDTIKSLLHSILHPLSHHEINSPVYKQELILLERAFLNLEAQLLSMGISTNFKCILEPSIKLKLTYVIDPATSHFFYYEIVLKEPVYLIKDLNGVNSISTGLCYCDHFYGEKNGSAIKGRKNKKDEVDYNYVSIRDAVEKIYNHIFSVMGFAIPPISDPNSITTYHDLITWQPLAKKLVW